MTSRFVITFLILLIACKHSKQVELFSVPAHFPKPLYHFDQNPLTAEGLALGKTLFNDKLLSKDQSISCASCHIQSDGFAQRGRAFSLGVGGQPGIRNALAIQNLAWRSDFFWDGGVNDLDFVTMVPLKSEIEMHTELGTVLKKLRQSPVYPKRFQQVYGTPEITTARFTKALSQYMLTLVSAHSRYDQYIQNRGLTFTSDEKAGLRLFKQKCSSCHQGVLFTDQTYRNNGLEPTKDPGRYRLTELEKDRYTFRVPSLRNVAVTSPYMHDGRFASLEEVLAHYAKGIKETPNLDVQLKKNKGIPLTSLQQKQIIAFLHTLTDESFLK
ncbi:MAG: cytochrome c peroxidase [Siphonobacter sp.]